VDKWDVNGMTAVGVGVGVIKKDKFRLVSCNDLPNMQKISDDFKFKARGKRFFVEIWVF